MQSTPDSPTAIHPIPRTVMRGGSPTPAYSVSEDSVCVLCLSCLFPATVLLQCIRVKLFVFISVYIRLETFTENFEELRSTDLMIHKHFGMTRI